MSIRWGQCDVILSGASRWMDEDVPPKWWPFSASSFYFTEHNKPQVLLKTLSIFVIYNIQLPLLLLSVSFSLCHMKICSLISMASSTIPCHYCATVFTTPILFHPNSHSRRLTYPLSHTNAAGLRGFSARCSYQPPHHSEFQNKHVSLLKIWSFFLFFFQKKMLFVSHEWRLCTFGVEIWYPHQHSFCLMTWACLVFSCKVCLGLNSIVNLSSNMFLQFSNLKPSMHLIFFRMDVWEMKFSFKFLFLHLMFMYS